MKFVLKLCFVVVFLAISGFIWLNQPEAAKNVATEFNSVGTENPRNLYVNNCARCHGADGRADTETGRLYDTPNISGGRLRKSSNKRLNRIITNGYGSMPAFGKKLSKADIAALVGYVRRL